MARPRKSAQTPSAATEIRKRVQIGADAKRLSEDKTLIKALQEISDRNYELFKSAVTDAEVLAAKRAFAAGEAFARHLLSHILVGRDATEMLRQEELTSAPPETYSFDEYKRRAMKAREDWAKSNVGDAT